LFVYYLFNFEHTGGYPGVYEVRIEASRFRPVPISYYYEQKSRIGLAGGAMLISTGLILMLWSNKKIASIKISEEMNQVEKSKEKG